MGAYFVGPGSYSPVVMFCQQAKPDFAIVVNECKAVHDIKLVSGLTKVEYRITGEDFSIDGVKALRLLPRLHAEAPEADFFAIANEIMPQDGAAAIKSVCDGYIQAILVASSMGLHITVGNLNTGFPLLRNDNLDAMTPMLQTAAEYHMPLACHYYNNGNPLGDPDALIWRTLADRAPGLQVIIEELGILNNQMVGGDAFDTFLTFDDLLDDRVIGCAIFALSSPSWASCNYESELPRLINHVKCVK